MEPPYKRQRRMGEEETEEMGSNLMRAGNEEFQDDDSGPEGGFDDEESESELQYTMGVDEELEDPDLELKKTRALVDQKLKSRFEEIFEKYGKDFSGIGDEIDLNTGEIVVNNGHLIEMVDEMDAGITENGRTMLRAFTVDDGESSDSDDEEESDILSEPISNASSDPNIKMEQDISGDMDSELTPFMPLVPPPPWSNRSQHNQFEIGILDNSIVTEADRQVTPSNLPSEGDILAQFGSQLGPQIVKIVAQQNTDLRNSVNIDPVWQAPGLATAPRGRRPIIKSLLIHRDNQRAASPEASVWAVNKRMLRRGARSSEIPRRDDFLVSAVLKASKKSLLSKSVFPEKGRAARTSYREHFFTTRNYMSSPGGRSENNGEGDHSANRFGHGPTGLRASSEGASPKSSKLFVIPKANSTLQGREGRRRLSFTREEDALILQFMQEIEALGSIPVWSMGLWQAFANEHPRHCWYSWRNRWKKIKDTPVTSAAKDPKLLVSTPQRKLLLPVRNLSRKIQTISKPYLSSKLPSKPKRKGVRFNPEDDRILLKCLKELSERGEKIHSQAWRELATLHPHHTLESWRNRYYYVYHSTDKDPMLQARNTIHNVNTRSLDEYGTTSKVSRSSGISNNSVVSYHTPRPSRTRAPAVRDSGKISWAEAFNTIEDMDPELHADLLADVKAHSPTRGRISRSTSVESGGSDDYNDDDDTSNISDVIRLSELEIPSTVGFRSTTSHGLQLNEHGGRSISGASQQYARNLIDSSYEFSDDEDISAPVSQFSQVRNVDAVIPNSTAPSEPENDTPPKNSTSACAEAKATFETEPFLNTGSIAEGLLTSTQQSTAEIRHILNASKPEIAVQPVIPDVTRSANANSHSTKSATVHPPSRTLFHAGKRLDTADRSIENTRNSFSRPSQQSNSRMKLSPPHAPQSWSAVTKTRCVSNLQPLATPVGLGAPAFENPTPQAISGKLSEPGAAPMELPEHFHAHVKDEYDIYNIDNIDEYVLPPRSNHSELMAAAPHSMISQSTSAQKSSRDNRETHKLPPNHERVNQPAKKAKLAALKPAVERNMQQKNVSFASVLVATAKSQTGAENQGNEATPIRSLHSQNTRGRENRSMAFDISQDDSEDELSMGQEEFLLWSARKSVPKPIYSSGGRKRELPEDIVRLTPSKRSSGRSLASLIPKPPLHALTTSNGSQDAEAPTS